MDNKPIMAVMPNDGREVHAVDVTKWLAFIPPHATIMHDGVNLVAVWIPKENHAVLPSKDRSASK